LVITTPGQTQLTMTWVFFNSALNAFEKYKTKDLVAE